VDYAERAWLAAPEDVVDGVPFSKFVVADAGAALFGVPLTFGLTYF